MRHPIGVDQQGLDLKGISSGPWLYILHGGYTLPSQLLDISNLSAGSLQNITGILKPEFKSAISIGSQGRKGVEMGLMKWNVPCLFKGDWT